MKRSKMDSPLDRLVGCSCCRLPCGRICRVEAVDNTARRIKIVDPARWTGWVTERRFLSEWKCNSK